MSDVTENPPVRGVVRVRVRYCECDPMNVAHHSSYIPWFELARTELLRDQGISYARLERDGVLLMVTGMELGFRSPVLYDDLIEVATTLVHTGRVRLRHAYEVRVVERMGEPVPPGSQPAATGTVELACCRKSDGRPMALPEAIRSRPEAGLGPSRDPTR